MLTEIEFSGMFKHLNLRVFDNLRAVLPNRGVIKIVSRSGTHVAQAYHDETDVEADIENVILLCQLKAKGEKNATTEETT